jgi:hypothetical protein
MEKWTNKKTKSDRSSKLVCFFCGQPSQDSQRFGCQHSMCDGCLGRDIGKSTQNEISQTSSKKELTPAESGSSYNEMVILCSTRKKTL